MEQNPLPIGITVPINCNKVVFILTSLCRLLTWLEDCAITLPQNMIGSLCNIAIKYLS